MRIEERKKKRGRREKGGEAREEGGREYVPSCFEMSVSMAT